MAEKKLPNNKLFKCRRRALYFIQHIEFLAYKKYYRFFLFAPNISVHLSFVPPFDTVKESNLLLRRGR